MLRLVLRIFFNGKYLIIAGFKCFTDILCINLITSNSILLQNDLCFLKDPLEKGTVL